MEVLLSVDGVTAEHVPTVTKNIDDLLNPGGSKKKNANDSSIDEPDMDAELVHLDEFESLFRVAPTSRAIGTSSEE